MDTTPDILSVIFSFIGSLIAIIIVIAIIKYVAKGALEQAKKLNAESKKGKHSTQFTMNGKEYDNLEDYYGEFTERSSESLKKVFGGLSDNPESIKKQIEESSDRIKNTIRNIFFVIFLIIFMGVVYYYLAK